MCRIATLAVALLAARLAALISAQDNYPSRPITVIAPFAAGGSVDWRRASLPKACPRGLKLAGGRHTKFVVVALHRHSPRR